MNARKSSLRKKNNEDPSFQLSKSNTALIRTVNDLTNITSELSGDIEKLDTYITAIEQIIDGKYTPYDEVNQLHEVVNEAKRQSEIIRTRYVKLVSFLAETKNKFGLADTVTEGDSNG
jgi:hypothetical protein